MSDNHEKMARPDDADAVAYAVKVALMGYPFVCFALWSGLHQVPSAACGWLAGVVLSLLINPPRDPVHENTSHQTTQAVKSLIAGYGLSLLLAVLSAGRL